MKNSQRKAMFAKMNNETLYRPSSSYSHYGLLRKSSDNVTAPKTMTNDEKAKFYEERANATLEVSRSIDEELGDVDEDELRTNPKYGYKLSIKNQAEDDYDRYMEKYHKHDRLRQEESFKTQAKDYKNNPKNYD